VYPELKKKKYRVPIGPLNSTGVYSFIMMGTMEVKKPRQKPCTSRPNSRVQNNG
jgi:hypothetical protein